ERGHGKRGRRVQSGDPGSRIAKPVHTASTRFIITFPGSQLSKGWKAQPDKLQLGHTDTSDPPLLASRALPDGPHDATRLSSDVQAGQRVALTGIFEQQ